MIGIGRAGGNIIDDLAHLDVLSGLKRANWIHIAEENHHHCPRGWEKGLPTASLSLSTYSTGGNVQLGRALALRHRYRLQALLASMDIVILIAGLGGGTGGGMTPYIAQLARIARTLTFAIVTMPFEFEGIRVQRANVAIRRLMRQTALVFALSNSQLAIEMGDEALLMKLIEVQNNRIACCLRTFASLLERKRAKALQIAPCGRYFYGVSTLKITSK